MSQTNAPFGLRPSNAQLGLGGSRGRAIPAGIGSGYAVNIFQNTPVQMSTGGTIVALGTTANTSAGDFIGSFQGVEFIQNGRLQVSNMWTASTTGTIVNAYVTDDPSYIYEIQANGPINQTAIGDQAAFVLADLTTPAGNTSTGMSAARISSTLAGAGAQAQLRIIDKSLAVDNDWGDPFTVVRVQIAQHQYVSNKVGI